MSVWLIFLAGLAVAVFSALLVGGARSANNVSGLIAFTRPDGVYVMRVDGSGVRRIAYMGQAALPGGVAWSPDGRKLAFANSDGIWVMDADGRDRVRLATAGITVRAGTPWFPRAANFGSPTWSADGRSIAYTAYQGDNRDLWIMNADGSDQRRLKRTPRLFEGEVDWSPTGGSLVFDSGGWVSDVYVMRTNGSDLRNLTPGRAWVGSGQPGWSSDGRKIVFARPSGIWVMDANGRSPVQLSSNKLDGFPDWSPEGRKIAFVRRLSPEPDSSGEIYVMDADGSGVTRLTHNRVADGSPAWQPIAAPRS